MKHPQVVEVINFLHELDLLEAHLEEHSHFMERIVIIESTKTYSGMDKPLYFEQNKKRFARFNVEHDVFDSDRFEAIPEIYPDEERKRWFDARRNNREKQQQYLFAKYRQEADYVCNTDVDEIWSRNHYGRVYSMMRDENCYIAPKVRRFMYFADAIGRSQDYWRITKATQDTHVRQKGTKRDSTGIEVGWHFSSVHNTAWGVWMKGVGLAQSIGKQGWKEVESPEELDKGFERGDLPFLQGQNLKALKSVMPIHDLSWMPPWMAENEGLWRWIPTKFRMGRRINTWRVGN